jgi:protein-tyrosine phosphatase
LLYNEKGEILIDLHCHILPGIDDGAPTMDVALKMARIAADDGIKMVACTPHIYPGMYENTAQIISTATDALRVALAEAGIELSLCYASDTHVAPDLISKLQAGAIPSFNGGRYFLLEPPHHVAPPNFESYVFNIMAAGFVPIITHPERLSWIEQDYDSFVRLANKGVWMQLTAGSLTGRFGVNARYWAERMLDEGLVHILATDSHGYERRAPWLREGVDAAAKWVGDVEAQHMVTTRPEAVLADVEPALVVPMLARSKAVKPQADSFFAKINNLFKH